jgi:nicotinate-nucleotide pyrophosphorylase (carboxylating)
MSKSQKIQTHFNQSQKLTIKNKKYLGQLKNLIGNFLDEDVDKVGDVTTDILISENSKASAKLIAKQHGVFAGIEETKYLLKIYNLKFTIYKNDCEKIKKGDVLLKISGGIKDILKVERTLLNMIQRMSGIATQTHKLQNLVGKKVLVVSTRKTHWGLLDKKAVVCGGGGTHRLGLYDFILIKDNHRHFAGADLEKKLIEIKNKKLFWEIECDTAEEVFQFAPYKPDVIMFDNFKPEQIKQTLKKLFELDKNYREIIFEASGGINESNIASYKNCGVDIISLGALTHSAKALDISLDIE